MRYYSKDNDATTLAACLFAKGHNPHIRLLVEVKMEVTQDQLKSLPGWVPGFDRAVAVHSLNSAMVGTCLNYG